MFNQTLIWYLVLPVLLALASGVLCFYVYRRSLGQSIVAALGGVFISAVVLTTVFHIGKGTKTGDTQILNGQITGKTRDHGHYLRPYDCNCRSVQSCSGSGSSRSCTSRRVCDTCYEDRYTVTWACQSTIGSFQIQHLDRTSRSVYQTPDPNRYTIIEKGDPVSRLSDYTNYIKAVPSSLFRPAQASLRAQFASQIPAYPNRVFDLYHVNRFVQVGHRVPDKAWNEGLSEMLKTLGPLKQVNVVMVVTHITDPNYFYALQDAWINGKKNDVVIVVGAPEFPKRVSWVNIMTLSKRSLFEVSLRDELMRQQNWTPETILPLVDQQIRAHYERRPMADFAYLDAEIDPPLWMMNVALGVIVLAFGWFFWQTWQHHQRGEAFTYSGVYLRQKLPRRRL